MYAQELLLRFRDPRRKAAPHPLLLLLLLLLLPEMLLLHLLLMHLLLHLLLLLQGASRVSYLVCLSR